MTEIVRKPSSNEYFFRPSVWTVRVITDGETSTVWQQLDSDNITVVFSKKKKNCFTYTNSSRNVLSLCSFILCKPISSRRRTLVPSRYFVSNHQSSHLGISFNLYGILCTCLAFHYRCEYTLCVNVTPWQKICVFPPLLISHFKGEQIQRNSFSFDGDIWFVLSYVMFSTNGFRSNRTSWYDWLESGGFFFKSIREIATHTKYEKNNLRSSSLDLVFRYTTRLQLNIYIYIFKISRRSLFFTIFTPYLCDTLQRFILYKNLITSYCV